MRVLLAVVLIATGIASATAADLPVIQSDRYSNGYYGVGDRTDQLLVYDFEPGVVVRAYWLEPWRNRHYFPATGIRPKIGRKENLSARTIGPREPAQTYNRYWSTTSAFLP